MNVLIAAILAAGRADRIIGGPNDVLGQLRARHAHDVAERAVIRYLTIHRHDKEHIHG